MFKNNTKCKACGDDIDRSEDIMTTLKGAYHAGNPDCKVVAIHQAPAPKTLAGVR